MSEKEEIKAIDCWINPNPPELAEALAKIDWLKRATTEYFKTYDTIAQGTPIEQMVGEMDAAGVEKGILTIQDPRYPESVASIVEKYPGRFIASAVIDPLRGMEAVRAVDSLVRGYGVKLIRLVPFMFNRPPNDKVCYPIYTKCIELEIPISINVGIPGPPMPAEPQRPLYLDEVCLFYPELKIIGAHGADPWWGEMIRLMIKYPNLYLMTSAWAPKYLPQELIHYMNTRGPHKVLFATDFPILPFERCVREAKELPFREGILKKFLRDNALRLFDWQ